MLSSLHRGSRPRVVLRAGARGRLGDVFVRSCVIIVGKIMPLLLLAACADITSVSLHSAGRMEQRTVAIGGIGSGCDSAEPALRAGLTRFGLMESSAVSPLLIMACSSRDVRIGVIGAPGRRAAPLDPKRVSEVELSLYDAAGSRRAYVLATVTHRRSREVAPSLVNAALERLLEKPSS